VRRAPTPQLPLAVVEGVAAILGLLVAAAGVAAVELADETTADGWAAVGVGGVLAVVALALMGLLKTLVVGSAPSSRAREAALAAIEVDPDTVEVEHLQLERLGPDELLIAARVRFQPQLTLAEVAGAIDRVERAIRTGLPAARGIYLEPAVDLDEGASAFVEARVGHIDPDDPDYADITGTHRLDDLWQ
jgi:divalent metal cation (Fe/Co/Zn/Cd) transporter